MKAQSYVLVDSEAVERLEKKIEVLQQTVNDLGIKLAVTPDKPNEMEVMFTEEVAALFKITPDTVTIWIKKGKLKKINPVGVRRNMFDRAAVMDLFDRRNRAKKPEGNPAPAFRRTPTKNKYGIVQLKRSKTPQ